MTFDDGNDNLIEKTSGTFGPGFLRREKALAADCCQHLQLTSQVPAGLTGRDPVFLKASPQGSNSPASPWRDGSG
jgi:hypothetical protein